MKFNGLMIDCSRLIERHEYYFKLIDFMAEWKMNTLVFHFTDDHGCAVRLPGFEDVAAKNAFTVPEIKKLLEHARKRKILVVPELETFGHIRYLTDVPRYSKLLSSKNGDAKQLHFNAIDPLNPESIKLIEKLICATAKVFDSKYLHIGCDEVDMREFCSEKGLDESQTWTDYTNKIIALTKKHGKIPMLWGDHPTNKKEIAGKLRKDIVLFDWRYEQNISEKTVLELRNAGFKDIIGAPSIACFGYRFQPGKIALENTRKMTVFAYRHGYQGIINTIWCPYRYFQDTLYYAIAFSAYIVKNGPDADIDEFKRKFARKVFGTDLTEDLGKFLSLWSKFDFNHLISQKLISGTEFSPEELSVLKKINMNSAKILKLAGKYRPSKNMTIYNSMILSSKCLWLCSEYILSKSEKLRDTGTAFYNKLLKETRKEASENWDRTRFPDDPHKFKSHYKGHEQNYCLLLLEKLSRLA